MLAASCIRPGQDGMVVHSSIERAQKSRALVVGYHADQPKTAHDVSSFFRYGCHE